MQPTIHEQATSHQAAINRSTINQSTINQPETNQTKSMKYTMSNSSNKSNEVEKPHQSKLANDNWLDFDPLGFDQLNDGIDADDSMDDDNIEQVASIHSLQTDAMNIDINIDIDGNQNDKQNANYSTAHSTNTNAVPKHNMNDTSLTEHPSGAIQNNNSSPVQSFNNNQGTSNTNTSDSNAFTAFDGDTSRANPNFCPLLPSPINKHHSNRQLIMDTETTGLNANAGDRIIEVGIVELVGRKFTGEKLHVYVNPQRGMSEEVIRVHGISEAFLQDMPTFDKVAQKVYDFMQGAEIIAHNAGFDMSFLNMEFAKVGLNDFAQQVKVTDSLAIAKHQYPGQKNTLDALVRRLNVGKQDRTFHGALLDSEILAEVYLAMTGGQVSLAIDDDMQQEGDKSNAHFAELASLLVASPINEQNHQLWLDSISKKHPEVKEVWKS